MPSHNRELLSRAPDRIITLELNGRPRQTLDWLKPHEKLDQRLNAANDALTG